MVRRFVSQISLLAIILFLSSVPKPSCAQGGKDIPHEWIDPDTGHRVVRLSDEPGSQSLYFHQNAYTAEGDKVVYTSRTGLYAYDFKSGKSSQLVEGRVSNVVVGPKTRQVFYMKGDSAYATEIESHKTREIVNDARLRTGSGFVVNADETMLG